MTWQKIRTVVFNSLCFVLVIVLLVGACSFMAQVNAKYEAEHSMFGVVESSSQWKIVYHKETRVMYAVRQGGFTTGNFEVLVNPDGSPMLYKEE